MERTYKIYLNSYSYSLIVYDLFILHNGRHPNFRHICRREAVWILNSLTNNVEIHMNSVWNLPQNICEGFYVYSTFTDSNNIWYGDYIILEAGQASYNHL